MIEVLEIRKYGQEVLQAHAREVRDIDARLGELVGRMRLTMYTANGIGLAAPQVGESIRLALVDITQGQDPDEFLVMINPEIVDQEGNETNDEGCLSFPHITVPISRSTRIQIKAYDLTGTEIRPEFSGMKARVIQHELDHLGGILILDRVSSLKKQLLKKEIKRLQKNDQW